MPLVEIPMPEIAVVHLLRFVAGLVAAGLIAIGALKATLLPSCSNFTTETDPRTFFATALIFVGIWAVAKFFTLFEIRPRGDSHGS
jgi:hypothetical protein